MRIFALLLILVPIGLMSCSVMYGASPITATMFDTTNPGAGAFVTIDPASVDAIADAVADRVVERLRDETPTTSPPPVPTRQNAAAASKAVSVDAPPPGYAYQDEKVVCPTCPSGYMYTGKRILVPIASPVSVKAKAVMRAPSEPGPHWTYPGRTKGELIQHLRNGADHAGDLAAYEPLEALDYNTLLTLHTQDHEHRLATGYSATRYAASYNAAPASYSSCPTCPASTTYGTRPTSYSNCPTCPSASYGTSYGSGDGWYLGKNLGVRRR